jgi:hypothetical protein
MTSMVLLEGACVCVVDDWPAVSTLCQQTKDQDEDPLGSKKLAALGHGDAVPLVVWLQV